MSALWHDVRYGIRTLFRSPGFTLVAVLSLGLGIGSITTVYSMVSSVLLSPLPYEDADRIVYVGTIWNSVGQHGTSVSYPDFLDWREQNTVFEEMAVVNRDGFNLSGPEGPERVAAGRISAGFFPMMRVEPVLGRNFTEEEAAIGGSRVAILSHSLWERRYGSRADIIGDGITLHGKSYTVVGVAPPGFRCMETGVVDLYVPMPQGTWFNEGRGSHWMRCMARLKDGVTPEEADAELKSIAARLSETYPDSNADKSALIIDPVEAVLGDGGDVAFLVLLGAVAFVLLIACVNVANLLLARAASRQKEVAVRMALGASRLRLVRQLLTESLLLAVLGGALGLLIAFWGVNYVMTLLPAEDAAFYIEFFEFGMNPDVFVFTAAIAIFAAFIFGLVPALQASNPDVNQYLKEGGSASGHGAGRHRLLAGLVVGEIALALVLLVGAGLMVQSFQQLQKADPGFDPENVLTSSISLPEQEYPEDQDRVAFYERLVDRLNSMSGVEAAGAASIVPFNNSNNNNAIYPEGMPALPQGQFYSAESRVITPGYFETLRANLLAGRDFRQSDRNPEAPVAIVNKAFADKFWPGEDGVGKRFKFGGHDSEGPWRTVVGVVDNIINTFGEGEEPEFYQPLAENPRAFMVLAVRTSSAPEAAIPTLRSTVADLDPDLPLSTIETMDGLMRISMWINRMNMMLLGIFAGVALVLASVGTYGVINYSVAQRTHEIGIRMALGAQPSDVTWLVVRRGMMLAGIGVSVGLVCAFGLTRLMTSMLYEVSPSDPIIFGVVTAVLTVVALSASYIPARRATRIDPMVALRYE